MGVDPPCAAPACALMRELVWLVEMEVVDHVSVGQRLLCQQVGDGGPVRPGGDDGVLRRNFAYGLRRAGLHARPAIGIMLFRLVHDLVKNQIGIAIGIMRGQFAPKHYEPIDAVSAGTDAPLVIALRMNVDLHSHSLGQHLIDGVVETADEVRVVLAEEASRERRGIDADPDVVEAELRHERDVGIIGVAVGLLSRVVARLREPLRSIDAVTQVLRAGKCGLHFRSTILTE